MSPQDTLTDRYAAPAPWRKGVMIAVVAVVVLAFGAWLAWTSWDAANPAVESELIGFEVVDEHTTSARIEVSLRNDDVDATCKLRAFAEDHNAVGDLSFTPDPAAPGEQFVEVRTERRATTVELIGCTAPGQARPR